MVMMSIYQVQIDDDNANDADHQDDHHQTKEVKGDAYTEGRRARAVGSSARHRFLIIIYITRSLGALRAPTSRLRPFGPA